MSPLTTPSGRVIGGRQQTKPDVEPEIAGAEQEVAEAEIEYDLAAADGEPGKVDQAHKRLGAARARVERVKAGLRGRERREREQAEALARRQDAARRLAFFEWHAEYVRRVGPVLALRQQLEEAERHLTAIGAAPNPSGPGDADRWKNSELWGSLPNPERTCARAIPSSPLKVHDVTLERITRGDGATPGRPRVVERLSGGNRFERLASAIDELAVAEREAAGDQAMPPRWT